MKILNSKRQQGLTLIELMIAMMLGLFIMAGVIGLFINSKQSYRIQESSSRLQENSRFAMFFITKDIRMADYWGCLNTTGSIDNNLNANATYDFFADAIVGEDNNATVDDVLDGTDVITIRGAFGSGAYVTQQPSTTSASIKVEDNSGLNERDIVLITDCIEGDIFQITNDPTVGSAGFDNLIHNTGTGGNPPIDPGNADKPLRKKYDTDAQVYKLNFATYYIKNSAQPSLYRTINGSSEAELVEGVENMQILYGEDTDNDKTPNYYLPAGSALLNMDNVVSVRVSLVMRSREDNITSTNMSYTIPGQAMMVDFAVFSHQQLPFATGCHNNENQFICPQYGHKKSPIRCSISCQLNYAGLANDDWSHWYASDWARRKNGW